MNRIAEAIERMKNQIAQRIESKLTSAEAVEKLHKHLDLPLDEFCIFQDLKSAAFASGKLNLEEAQLVYQLLGTTPEVFNAQPIEVKSVLTSLLQELLSLRIEAAA